jgi:membrane protein YdbS with pleckstrin-like domain
MLEGADERICLDARRHGVVLARPVAKAVGLALLGGGALFLAWPFSAAGAPTLAAAALVCVRAVWRWDRTRVVVTTEKLFVVHGVLRRSAAGVPLRGVQAIELEQTLPGRVLGYGTLVVGPLEVTHVPQARRVYRLVERLCG